MLESTLPPDPYKTLGVAKDAPIATIRSAHRKLVLQCHPDKFPDEAIKAVKADQFHQVQTAYELLSDQDRRERYDAEVQLADLRAEMMAKEMKVKGGIRKMPTDYGPSPHTPATPMYETRGQHNLRGEGTQGSKL